MFARISKIVCFLALAGCGDQLVGPDYLGRPLYELEGTVIVTSEDAFADNVDLALVWLGRGQEFRVAKSFTQTRFPASFTMSLYETPSDSALFDVPGTSTAKVAIGRMIAFQDTDRDGRLEPREPLLGGAYNHVVTYFTENGESAIVDGPFKTGFNLRTLVACSERDELWMQAPETSNVSLEVDRTPRDISTDLDCDENPEDLCFEALITLSNPANQTELSLALETYEREGCEEFYGDVMVEGCPDGNCPDPCENGECDCPDGECEDACIIYGCDVCNNMSCDPQICGHCNLECPNGNCEPDPCVDPNGDPANCEPTPCNCSQDCPNGSVCEPNGSQCVPFCDPNDPNCSNQMNIPCQTDCECPSGMNCDIQNQNGLCV